MQESKVNKEFYEAIGRAITEWASVESRLFELYFIALGGAMRHVAVSAFYAGLSFQVKLQTTTDALETRINHVPTDPGFTTITNHPLTLRWTKIQRKLDKVSKQRNHLAHYHVFSTSNGPELRRNPRNPKFYASFHDASKVYSTDKINDLRGEFVSHQREMIVFQRSLVAELKQRGEYPPR